MSTTFIVSDTHYGHANTFEKFKKADGSPLRPFSSVEEMNETMIERWNAVVGENDRVIHCGDVVINKKYIDQVLPRLNGTKELVLGNHDIHLLEKLAPYFKQMTSMKVKDDLIFTHIPIHPDSVERFGCNVHGHLHDGRVMWEIIPDKPSTRTWHGTPQIDPRYMNVCVEHTDFQPITLDELRKRIKEQQEAAQYVPSQSWSNGSGPN